MAKGMLCCLGEGLAALPSRSGTGLTATPAPKIRGQTKGNNSNRGEPPGLDEEGRGSLKGLGVHLMNASGLEDVNGKGRAKGSNEGHGGRDSGGRRKSNHAAWDKSFVALSDSQSINWCLLEPGYAGEC